MVPDAPVKEMELYDLVEVAGDRNVFMESPDFWLDLAKAIPVNAEYLVLTMGDVTDYFKPACVFDNSCGTLTNPQAFEAMLDSNKLHLWSPDAAVWYKPQYCQQYTVPN